MRLWFLISGIPREGAPGGKGENYVRDPLSAFHAPWIIEANIRAIFSMESGNGGSVGPARRRPSAAEFPMGIEEATRLRAALAKAAIST
jgi:hypothetical protein